MIALWLALTADRFLTIDLGAVLLIAAIWVVWNVWKAVQ